jgi:formate dehydrogenase maturation protein FdhE
MRFVLMKLYLLNRNPTPETFEWKSTKAFPLDYMKIGNTNGQKPETLIEMQKDLYAERADFWSELKAHYPVEKYLEQIDVDKNEIKQEL